MKRLARDVMSPEIFAVYPDLPLSDLAKLFAKQRISGTPVIDRKGHLVGVISKTDLLGSELRQRQTHSDMPVFYEAAQLYHRQEMVLSSEEEILSGTVMQAMSKKIVAVQEDQSLDEVAQTMSREKVHRVIVLEKKKVVGIISALDVLAHFPRV